LGSWDYVTDYPCVFNPKCGRSLNTLSNLFQELNCFEEALNTSKEAARVFVNLAQERLQVTLELAASVNNLILCFGK
jgi:hypothetical protein